MEIEPDVITRVTFSFYRYKQKTKAMFALSYIKRFSFNSLGWFFATNVFFSSPVFSQEEEAATYLKKTDKGYVVHATVENGDTLPYVWLPWISIQAEIPFKSKRQFAQWTRIRYYVKTTYPYAILAAAKLKEYDLILAKMPQKYRPTYLKMCEKEMTKQFGAELKDLSVGQGKMLMKLIDRETGKTTYTIVKELRGNFQAFMWQSLAVLFGNTMKVEYDGEGEDKLIELAVRQVESGQF